VRKKRVDLNPNSLIYRDTNDIDKWYKLRGKKVGLGREKLRELKELFSALDDDGSAAIGVDELENPLITLGLVNDRYEIKSIVDEVDDDKTGEIELSEFLQIFMKKNLKSGDEGDNRIKEFFQYLESGEYK